MTNRQKKVICVGLIDFDMKLK